MTHDIELDWDDWFNNTDHIPDDKDYVGYWTAEAAGFRANNAAIAELDIPYGRHERQKLDLFRPSRPSEGLVVFVHGGYWLKFDKSYWSHLAQGPVIRDWSVALPSYRLAPEATIPEITDDIAAAVSRAAELVDGPIHLAGHSAGGHLVTRMVCENALPAAVAARVKRVVSISGVHDLRRLRLTGMNAELKIDAATAHAESPIFAQPLQGPYVTAWVGAGERPEFLAQTRQLVESWSGKGAFVDAVYEPRQHHFNVIEGLEHDTRDLCEALLRDRPLDSA